MFTPTKQGQDGRRVLMCRDEVGVGEAARDRRGRRNLERRDAGNLEREDLARGPTRSLHGKNRIRDAVTRGVQCRYLNRRGRLGPVNAAKPMPFADKLDNVAEEVLFQAQTSTRERPLTPAPTTMSGMRSASDPRHTEGHSPLVIGSGGAERSETRNGRGHGRA